MIDFNQEISSEIKLIKISQRMLLKRWYDQYNNQIINGYEMVDFLGAGAYAKVYRAKSNDKLFALKVYLLKELENTRYTGQKEYSSNIQLLQLELQITQVLNHQNIVRCHAILSSKEEIITVNEMGDLGDLMKWNEFEERFQRNKQVYKYISNKYKTKSLMKIMKIIFKQVCQGIAYLHGNNMTHRDIKPSNIVAKRTSGENDQIKIIDFNTARYHSNNDLSYYPAGTAGFRAPEHQFGLAQGYSSKAADIWSLGITIYVYYHEELTFKGETQLQIDISAKNKQIQFIEQCPSFLSDTILKMTSKNYKQRIEINQVLKLIQRWQQQ